MACSRDAARPALLLLALAVGLGVATTGCATPHAAVRHVAVIEPATPPSASRAATGNAPASARAVWPLTGLPATGDVGQPALSVKIDNAPAARPQSGLNAADLVVEEPVEGGLSRFLAVFDSQEATVGPVRSARPVDGALLRALNGGVFAYSGAAAGEIAPTRAYSRALLVNDDVDPKAFWRSRTHPAPDNLYASSTALRALGARRATAGSPTALFRYGPVSAPARPGRRLELRLGQYSDASWSYDGSGYRRSEQGSPHRLEDGSVVTATNVLVLTVAVAHSGITDANHVEDPFVLVYGAGAAVVVRDGKAVTGRWSRSGVGAPFRFVAADGSPLTFAPGRTWVELVPQPGGAIPAGSYAVS